MNVSRAHFRAVADQHLLCTLIPLSGLARHPATPAGVPAGRSDCGRDAGVLAPSSAGV